MYCIVVNSDEKVTAAILVHRKLNSKIHPE